MKPAHDPIIFAIKAAVPILGVCVALSFVVVVLIDLFA
jgi:hypothetical protein